MGPHRLAPATAGMDSQLSQPEQRQKKEKIWLAIRSRNTSDGGGRREVDPAQHREEARRADAAFERLKSNERFVINLRLLEGLRYRQISEMTGWSEEAARKAYDRAIARLKTLYEANGKS